MSMYKVIVHGFLGSIYKFLRSKYEWLQILTRQFVNIILLLNVRHLSKSGKKIKVSFFCIYSSIWKYDELFQMMLSSDQFEPQIVICPVVNRGRDHLVDEINKSIVYFEKKKYPIFVAYDLKKDAALPIEKGKYPHIIFYTNPYKGLIDDSLFITKFKFSLCCYVPYAFFSVEGDWVFNTLFHNFCWKIFAETSMHVELAKQYQRLRSVNMVATGYPGCDPFFSFSQSRTNPWDPISSEKIKIIWAPHHLKISNFLKYSEFFLSMPLLNDKVSICFKPHPLLKSKLIEIWGEENTTNYYNAWQINDGKHFINEGDYVDLFLSSDALIHDCGSFIFEYLFTKKPCLFLDSEESKSEVYSNIGQLALSQHYHSSSLFEVECFINDVLLNKNDYMFFEREKVVMEAFAPVGGNASKNIFNYLLNQIRG